MHDAARPETNAHRPPRAVPERSILKSLNEINPIFERLSARPTTDDESLNVITELAIKLHISSGPLKRLPPARRWSRSLQNAWVRALKDFAPHLRRAIEAYKADP